MRILPSALLAAGLFAAAPAIAHPKLLSATPAPEATITTGPQKLTLNFSEKLVPQFSAAEVTMTEMPGMAMSSPHAFPGKSAVGPDGKSLVVTFAKPLPRGSYRVDWRVVSSDTHRITGNYTIKVK